VNSSSSPLPGRIDTHAHLIPNVDDGCKSVADSVFAARQLVEAGYTHAFCTPHIWPNLRANTAGAIRQWVVELQAAYDAAFVNLTLLPGGELSLPNGWPRLRELPVDEIVTAGLAGRHVLFDFWDEQLPEGLEAAVRYLVGLGITPILAHPERIGAFQNDPSAVDTVVGWGCWLQMNTWTLAMGQGSRVRTTAERLLRDNRYTLFGTDTHDSAGVAVRVQGLAAAADLVGWDVVDRLTRVNPAQLLPSTL
jgi:protein-tyrosine phosphatase